MKYGVTKYFDNWGGGGGWKENFCVFHLPAFFCHYDGICPPKPNLQTLIPMVLPAANSKDVLNENRVLKMGHNWVRFK